VNRAGCAATESRHVRVVVAIAGRRLHDDRFPRFGPLLLCDQLLDCQQDASATSRIDVRLGRTRIPVRSRMRDAYR
jgi:hypothetical protein